MLFPVEWQFVISETGKVGLANNLLFMNGCPVAQNGSL